MSSELSSFSSATPSRQVSPQIADMATQTSRYGSPLVRAKPTGIGGLMRRVGRPFGFIGGLVGLGRFAKEAYDYYQANRAEQRRKANIERHVKRRQQRAVSNYPQKIGS